MALKETTKHMRDLLEQITSDLPKAENGNKAASQRIRTGTVKLEKTAKKYRKESIVTEKGTKGGKKRPVAAKKNAAKKSTAKPAKHAKHPAKPAKKAAPKKASPSSSKKTTKSKHSSRPHAFSVRRAQMSKRPTAKLARKSAM